MFRNVKYDGKWYIAEECYAQGHTKGTKITYYLIAGHIIVYGDIEEFGEYKGNYYVLRRIESYGESD